MKNKLYLCSFLFALAFSNRVIPQVLCNAGFTHAQTAANEITFTNTSTGGVAPDYIWDFGDGILGYSASPVHVYSIPGTYNVCLVMYDSSGSCSSTFCDSVTVTGTVICNLNANVTAYSASCATCPDGSAVSVPTGGSAPFSFIWSTSATTQTITGITPGTYSVCVTDTNGCSDCDTVTVLYSTCNASFTNTIAGSTGTFTSTSSGTASSTFYNWDFGDGSTGSGTPISHTYAIGGYYNVCLSLYDSSTGCADTQCDSIFITGGGSALCSALFTIYPDSSVASTYWAVNVSTGSGLTYIWNWGDGSSSTGPYPSHTYASPGLYTICLTVSNGFGCTDSMCSTYNLLRMATPTAPVTINVTSGFTGIQSSLDESSPKLTLFPVPAQDRISYAVNGLHASETVQIKIMDVAGKILLGQNGQNTGDVTLDQFPAGFYIFQVVSESGPVVKIFSVQR